MIIVGIYRKRYTYYVDVLLLNTRPVRTPCRGVYSREIGVFN